jgi:hypothetical protein
VSVPADRRVVVPVEAAVLVSSRRDRALELIAQGRASVPLVAAARERQRLVEPRFRERLARSLDDIQDDCELAMRGARPVRPLFSVRVVRAAAPELTRVATLVRGDRAGLPGIAMAERLVTNGCSPLYGEDLGLLLEELRRTRFLLEA